MFFFELTYHALSVDTGYYESKLIHTYIVPGMTDGKRITFIQPKFDINQVTDEMVIWLAGERGLIRQILFLRGKVGAHKAYDISPTDDVTYLNDGYGCTSRGKIYKLNTSSNAFHLDATPTSNALRYISKDLAVGENGTFCKHEGDDSWTFYQVEELTYQYGYLDDNNAGLTVSLIDTQWNSHMYVYQNLPTVINSVKPDSLFDYVNSGCAAYINTDKETIIVTTSDPEGNHTVPAVYIKRGSTINIPFDLKELKGMKYPAYQNALRLRYPSHQLVLRNDSALYVAPAERYTKMMWDYIWMEETFTRGNIWLPGDTVVIRFVTDSLRIWYDNSVGTTAQVKPGMQARSYIIGNAKHITISNPKLMFQRMQIYNIQGKLLEEYSLDNRQIFSIPNRYSSDMLIFTLTGRNNAVTYKYFNTK